MTSASLLLLIVGCASFGGGVAGLVGSIHASDPVGHGLGSGLAIGFGLTSAAISLRSPRSYVASVLAGLGIGAAIGYLATAGEPHTGDWTPMNRLALAGILLGVGLPTLVANLVLGEEPEVDGLPAEPDPKDERGSLRRGGTQAG